MAGDFEIRLGRLWLHRPRQEPYREWPLAGLTPADDIHGELSFHVQGRQVPGMGYLTYDEHPRDGACMGEWIMYLRDVLNALDGGPKASFLLREYDLVDSSFAFVRDGDTVLFSVEHDWGGPEPGWEAVSFAYADLWDQFEAFRQSLLDRIAAANPAALPHWQKLF